MNENNLSNISIDMLGIDGPRTRSKVKQRKNQLLNIENEFDEPKTKKRKTKVKKKLKKIKSESDTESDYSVKKKGKYDTDTASDKDFDDSFMVNRRSIRLKKKRRNVLDDSTDDDNYQQNSSTMRMKKSRFDHDTSSSNENDDMFLSSNTITSHSKSSGSVRSSNMNYSNDSFVNPFGSSIDFLRIPKKPNRGYLDVFGNDNNGFSKNNNGFNLNMNGVLNKNDFNPFLGETRQSNYVPSNLNLSNLPRFDIDFDRNNFNE